MPAGGDAIIVTAEDAFSAGEDHTPVLRASATVIRWVEGR